MHSDPASTLCGVGKASSISRPRSATRRTPYRIVTEVQAKGHMSVATVPSVCGGARDAMIKKVIFASWGGTAPEHESNVKRERERKTTRL